MPSPRPFPASDRASIDVERLVLWLVGLATVAVVVWTYVTFA
jgi:hypothetical protein